MTVYQVLKLVCSICNQDLNWDYKYTTKIGVVAPCENCTTEGKQHKKAFGELLKELDQKDRK